MRLRSRARAVRATLALSLALSSILPAAAVPVAAADDLVLNIGTTQELDSTNPYDTALVTGYDTFLLTYDLLVNFGPDLEPWPGFAELWERASDGKSWEFKIREGMTWSDGEPATAEDACFSFQLNLDAIAAEGNVGIGYIDPSLGDAGATAVDCPDDTTMIISTEDASTRILQTYIPILPKHIFEGKTWENIGDAEQTPFNAPLVGTGPYKLAEWKTGEYVRFERNDTYWGEKGDAAEIVIRFFANADTMVQALRAGEIDYARGVNNDQFDALQTEEHIVTVEGTSNGWTELGFNAYGSGTGKTIPDGGPSTPALLDPAFRDALGYAVDKQQLLDRILGGYGTIGTTQVPPVLGQWHTEPATVRTFDLALAGQKLETAGYLLDSSNRRLDKEGNPINLSLVMPDSDDQFPDIAQFVQDWWGQLGITVTPQVLDSDTLIDLMLPPEAGGAANKADYDLFIWTWAGNPDPNALLDIFTCDAIGSSSDSNWCDEDYDRLFEEQNVAPSVEERKALLTEMQEMFYTQAPYHILYYDSELHAYRDDKFTGWANQPTANGTPFFTYGTINYSALKDVTTVAPSPSASAAPGASGAASPLPSGSGSSTADTGSNTPLILGGAVVILLVAAGGLLLARRRGKTVEEE